MACVSHYQWFHVTTSAVTCALVPGLLAFCFWTYKFCLLLLQPAQGHWGRGAVAGLGLVPEERCGTFSSVETPGLGNCRGHCFADPAHFRWHTVVVNSFFSEASQRSGNWFQRLWLPVHAGPATPLPVDHSFLQGRGLAKSSTYPQAFNSWSGPYDSICFLFFKKASFL